MTTIPAAARGLIAPVERCSPDHACALTDMGFTRRGIGGDWVMGRTALWAPVKADPYWRVDLNTDVVKAWNSPDMKAFDDPLTTATWAMPHGETK